MKKIFVSFLFLIFLSSCGEESFKVEPIKKTDRQLSCNDIMLEINDAEFYKKQAEEKKSLGVKSIVMPLGYIDTYMNADEAVVAATSRVDYLKKIYQIKGCGTPQAGARVPEPVEIPQASIKMLDPTATRSQ